MTRSEREQLIERYLREELTPSEEQEFFIEVATDKELRFDLKASRVVESTFRKDREAAPTAYAPVRASLAQLLAASRAEQTSGTSGEPLPAPQSASPDKRSHTGWIVTAASIGLLSLVALFLGILAIDRTGEEKMPTAIEREGTQHIAPQFPAAETPAVPVEEQGSPASRNTTATPGITPQNRADQTTRPAHDAAATDRKNPARNGNRQQTQGTQPPSNEVPAKPITESPIDTIDPNFNGHLEFEGPRQ